MNERRSELLAPARRFGTFGGVFTPCTLTILGVIMFLRLGHVVGQAGVLHAVAIVAISNAITLLTALSLSSIVSNTRVKGGGAYYLISRTLGEEFGGAIGIVFYLAQSIAVALYVIGFSEAVISSLPGDLPLKWVATTVNVGVFICVYIGAGWTIRVQYFILAALVAALVSFYAGAFHGLNATYLQENLGPHYTHGQSFFSMLALFFPAVTGIMAGANLSGDLKNPGQSIPRGTLAAIVVTGLVYVSLVLLLGCTRPTQTLISDSFVIRGIAWSPIFITIGVFAATLSSALSSMMGAPRILQAFSRDDVFQWLHPMAQGSGAAGEPRRAILVTFAISQVSILLADLNAIAPIITMAFLITYSLINFATFCEATARNPSYRPIFRFSHWSTSLLGAAACLVVMFLIHWIWAAVAMAAMGLLYWYIGRQRIQSRWGDVQRGLLFERARQNLLKLEEEQYHPKNWRPIILALSGAGWSRPHLAEYAHWFTAGRGVLSLGHVIHGEVEDRLERRISQERLLKEFIRQHDLQAFPAVVVSPDLSDGIEALVQTHGLGALRPNTVLLGWPTGSERAEPFGTLLRTVAGLQCSIVAMRFLKEPADPWHAPQGTVDVWWRGQKNGALMLLFAHLLTQNHDWRGRQIRLLRVVDSANARRDVLSHLTALIEASRIRATPVVVVGGDAPVAIHGESQAAAIVFLGFDTPEKGKEMAFYERMEALAGNLPRAAFVSSIGGVSLDS